ncbi:hypothetical protein [Nitrosospira sp. Is2]|uniref:hypothetical protein n=1 Tax=Nitrosospira sp. Is2 TaxID=3080532 RepID=UPI0029556172|nr:hypothetical protein [Nitrosospira sp. Is2]WON73742.1 hypothetical protein R5L00_14865 [Nitrosospira sp. Is2]
MRVTIIRDDGVVGVDGVFRRVDLSTLPARIRALQWNGVSGHVEYDHGANTTLHDLAAFQTFVELWNAAAPQPPVPPGARQMTAAAFARIDSAYEAAVKAMTKSYPGDEVGSWPQQEAEARAWLMDSRASTPWIDAAATGRGIDKAALIDKIITKASLFTPAHGQLTGKRQKLRDEIIALGDNPTQQQLDAIQW